MKLMPPHLLQAPPLLFPRPRRHPTGSSSSLALFTWASVTVFSDTVVWLSLLSLSLIKSPCQMYKWRPTENNRQTKHPRFTFSVYIFYTENNTQTKHPRFPCSQLKRELVTIRARYLHAYMSHGRVPGPGNCSCPPPCSGRCHSGLSFGG
jgi:hypothetical protein